jgi:hypothetical protein
MVDSVFNWLRSLIRPIGDIKIDSDLGPIQFESGLGWTGTFPARMVGFVIGSDTPSPPANATINYLKEVEQNLITISEIGKEHLRRNSGATDDISSLLKSITVASIQLLWPIQEPHYLRIEFSPDSDDRIWYVEMESLVPVLCGFDH